jgi:hypothetical protein
MFRQQHAAFVDRVQQRQFEAQWEKAKELQTLVNRISQGDDIAYEELGDVYKKENKNREAALNYRIAFEKNKSETAKNKLQVLYDSRPDDLCIIYNLLKVTSNPTAQQLFTTVALAYPKDFLIIAINNKWQNLLEIFSPAISEQISKTLINLIDAGTGIHEKMPVDILNLIYQYLWDDSHMLALIEVSKQWSLNKEAKQVEASQDDNFASVLAKALELIDKQSKEDRQEFTITFHADDYESIINASQAKIDKEYKNGCDEVQRARNQLLESKQPDNQSLKTPKTGGLFSNAQSNDNESKNDKPTKPNKSSRKK